MNAELAEKRHLLADRGISSRVAAYTTAEPGSDAARLATEHDVDLVLVDSSSGLPENRHPDAGSDRHSRAGPMRRRVLVGAGDLGTGPVVTPFGGVEHDYQRSNSLRGLQTLSAQPFVFSEPKRTRQRANAMPAGS